jgi:hypothetical protein
VLLALPAEAAPQCKKYFEDITVSDGTRIQAENEAAYFASTIISLTENMESIPFGKKMEQSWQWLANYRQSVSRAEGQLRSNDHDFGSLARFDFVLKPGASERLKKKIRILIENEYASVIAHNTSLINFKLFYKFVQLAEYPPTKAQEILQTVLEKRLSSLHEIERTDKVAAIIIENLATPHADSFLKVVQEESPANFVAITNDRNLSLEPYDDPNEKMNEFGVNFIRMETDDNKYTQELEYGGKDYQLEISYKKGNQIGLFKRKMKPQLNEMWKDKELLGTILIDNYFISDGTWLVDEYKDYYRSQGFEFARAQTMKIEDAFIKPFTNGKIDYLVSEHSGDLSTSKNPQVLIGTRRTPRGIEKIQIIFSKPGSSNPAGQSYTFDSETELPRLIRLRNNNNVKTEMIYINGQCFTACELRELAERVDSEHFTYIGPSTLAETFTNADTSPLQALITGIRQGLDYSKIQILLKKAQRANQRENQLEASDNENSFRLPNEAIDKRVNNGNAFHPVEQYGKIYSAQLLDEKGKKRPVELIPLD